MFPRKETECVYSQEPDKRTWSVAQKALRLAGSFAYRYPIVQYQDRPLRENSFVNRDDPLIGGSLIGYLTVYEQVLIIFLDVCWIYTFSKLPPVALKAYHSVHSIVYCSGSTSEGRSFQCCIAPGSTHNNVGFSRCKSYRSYLERATRRRGSRSRQ
jgi:hypothetical protein